jgi:hypothetical protein
MNFAVGPLGGIHDLRSALIEHRVIVSLHPDPNNFPRGSHDLVNPLRYWPCWPIRSAAAKENYRPKAGKNRPAAAVLSKTHVIPKIRDEPRILWQFRKPVNGPQKKNPL